MSFHGFLSIGPRAEKCAPGLRRKRTAISGQKLNKTREQVEDIPISIWLRKMCIFFILISVSGSVYGDGKDCAPSGIYQCKESIAIGIDQGNPRQWAEGEFLLELKSTAGESVSEAIIAYGDSTWRLGKTYSRDGMDSALECVQGMIQARKGILITFHMAEDASRPSYKFELFQRTILNLAPWMSVISQGHCSRKPAIGAN